LRHREQWQLTIGPSGDPAISYATPPQRQLPRTLPGADSDRRAKGTEFPMPGGNSSKRGRESETACHGDLEATRMWAWGRISGASSRSPEGTKTTSSVTAGRAAPQRPQNGRAPPGEDS